MGARSFAFCGSVGACAVTRLLNSRANNAVPNSIFFMAIISLRDERGSPGSSNPTELRQMLHTLMIIAVGTHYLVTRSVLHRRAWFTLGQGKCHWLFLDAPGNQSSHSRVLTGD